MTSFPLLNTQPPEKMVFDGGGVLDVVGTPFKTIQGEGPFSGVPAVFVRMAGCVTQCPMCDTNYTEGRKHWAVENIVQFCLDLLVPKFAPYYRTLVVLTGGEPLRQPIGLLARQLLLNDFYIQLETNGLCYREDFPWSSPNLHVVCSPKGQKIDDGLQWYVNSYKYPIRAGEVSEEDGLPTRTLGLSHAPARPHAHHSKAARLFLTPIDEDDPHKTENNLKTAVASAMKFGYTVQTQLHKTLGVP